MSNADNQGKGVDEPVERYALSVASTLLDDGIPVEHLHVVVNDPPAPDEPEVECTLFLPSEWARQHVHPDAIDAGLDWDCLSGWSMSVEWHDTNRQHVIRTWYMNAGLIPSQEAVAAFTASMLVDRDTAGTANQGPGKVALMLVSGLIEVSHEASRPHG